MQGRQDTWRPGPRTLGRRGPWRGRLPAPQSPQPVPARWRGAQLAPACRTRYTAAVRLGNKPYPPARPARPGARPALTLVDRLEGAREVAVLAIAVHLTPQCRHRHPAAATARHLGGDEGRSAPTSAPEEDPGRAGSGRLLGDGAASLGSCVLGYRDSGPGRGIAAPNEAGRPL